LSKKILSKNWDKNMGGEKLKCLFNPDEPCAAYTTQKEALGFSPSPEEIIQKFCPQCPKLPRKFEG